MYAGAYNLTGKLPPQSRLHNDQYLIVDTVGQGGMGAVYEAVDITAQPKRRVAIKEMSQSQLKTPKELDDARKRFKGEANMLRSLDHPNLPHVYDSFEERGRSYLVMEFIEGRTLLQLLQAFGGHPLPLEHVLNYACQLCSVLDYLHRQYPPIIFRDLKPSNVMVTAEGRLYLIDFGIARFFKDGQNQAKDTESFVTKGYAPPEQYQGSTSPRSDLYSFGATLHTCLTARNPISNTPTLFDFPPLCQYAPYAPKDLERLLQRLLEFKESRRPNSAEDVRQELVNIIQQSQDLAMRFAQISPFPLHPVLPATQSKLILSGDGASYNDKTFSANSPQPAPATPLPQWIINLGSSTKFFFAAVAAFLVGIFASARTAFAAHAGQQLSLAHIGSGIRHMGEDLALAVRTWSSRVLTPRFVFLLLVRLAAFIVGSIFLFHAFQDSYAVVAFCLSLALLFITVAGSISTKIRDPIARNLLFCTSLATLITCIALQADPDVQSVIHAITFSQLLAFVLVTGAGASLVRTSNRFTGIDNIAVVLIAASMALLQYAFGPQELISLPGVVLSSDSASAITQGLTALLGLIAFISLCRITRPFSSLDRLLLLLVALLFTGLQITKGYTELQHLPFMNATGDTSSGRSSNVAYLDILLIIVPILFAVIAIFTGKRFEYFNRIAIFALALGSALLQSAAAPDVVLSLPTATTYPLMNTVVDTFTLDQIVLYGGLAIAGLLLLVRLVLKANWIDRPALYIVGFDCALLLWSLAPQMTQLPSLSSASSGVSQDLFLALHQILGTGLLLVVFCGIVLALGTALTRLARQIAWVQAGISNAAVHLNWVDRALQLIDRLLIFGSILAAALLILFLGSSADHAHLLSLFVNVTSGLTIPISVFIALGLGILALVALFRFSRPFNRWDCLSVLLAILSCALLAFENTVVQQVASPVIDNLQQVMGSILQGNNPTLLLLFGFLAAAGLSLLWLRRSLPRDQMLYFILFVLFSGALICFFLHFIWPVLLLVALLMLIHGVFVATQMERVR